MKIVFVEEAHNIVVLVYRPQAPESNQTVFVLQHVLRYLQTLYFWSVSDCIVMKCPIYTPGKDKAVTRPTNIKA